MTLTARSAFPLPAAGLQRRQVLALASCCLGLGSVRADDLTDLARVQASGVLKVAVYKDNAPFSSGKSEDMTGLDVSLAAALAKQLNLKLALLPFDAGEKMNDDLRNMVWRGHYLGYGPADVMLHVPVDRYLMQNNRQVFIFAPYMRQVPILMVDTRQIPQVSQPEDLKGFALSGERGAGLTSLLMGYGGGLLRNQISIHDSGTLAAKAVLEGKAAAAYVTRAQAEAAMAGMLSRPDHIEFVDLVLGAGPSRGWPIGLAVKSDHKQLAEALEGAMSRLRASGELLAIFREQGLTLTAP